MDEYTNRAAGKIGTSTLYQTTILRNLFPKHKFYLYKELYAELPETSIDEKIIKLRLMYHLEREEFAKLLNCHMDTVQRWELDDIMPKPENILNISHSGLARLLSGRISLSYEMYLKLKELAAF